MTDEKKVSTSLLSKIKPAVATLNKKLIIAIAGVLAVLILIILINSLDQAPANMGGGTTTRSGSGLAGTPPGNVSGLPSSYSAGDQINSMLNRDVNGLSPAAAHQISALQTEQQTLQQQLMQMRQQGLNTASNQPSPFSQEAASSSIFFAGGAPPPSNQQPENSTTGKKDADNTSKNGTDNTYQQQNMQGQKLDFLTSQPSKAIYNDNTVQYPASPYILQAGSVIPALLQSKISTNLPGTVTAIVSQDVYDSISGQYLLIPRGSRLIGSYNSTVSFGQDQVQVKFTRLIRPDGTSILLPNQEGTDAMGTAGFKDDVNNHWGRIIGSAVLSAVFSLPALVATNELNTNNSTSCGPNGCTNNGNSAGSVLSASALQSMGQGASQVGTQIATQSLNIQPNIIINAGYQFSVMVTKDIVLPPYSEGTNNVGHP
ncbi:MAG: TrbI/VirB10 family protein [Gammaproteobacteria bacterium]|nr:TrbI/VirB10 family protein [Gammaproteobacteria bacterium]